MTYDPLPLGRPTGERRGPWRLGLSCVSRWGGPGGRSTSPTGPLSPAPGLMTGLQRALWERTPA
jgi:hypothetical protein